MGKWMCPGDAPCLDLAEAFGILAKALRLLLLDGRHSCAVERIRINNCWHLRQSLDYSLFISFVL